MIPEREEQNNKYGDAEDDGDDRSLFCCCRLGIRRALIAGARVPEEFMEYEIVKHGGCCFFGMDMWCC